MLNLNENQKIILRTTRVAKYGLYHCIFREGHELTDVPELCQHGFMKYLGENKTRTKGGMISYKNYQITQKGKEKAKEI